MSTGQKLGPEWSSRQWKFFVLNLLLSLLVFGDLAVSKESSVRSRKSAFLTEETTRQPLQPPRTFSNDRLLIEGKMQLGSQYISNETDEGGNASFGLGVKLNYKFIDWLKLRSETRLTFSQERFQAQLDDDRFSNGFSFKEAVAVVEPSPYFEMGAGAVNQSQYISSPMLISNRAFPGLYEQVQYNRGHNYLSLRLGQSMPTSQSFDANRQEKEETPYFYTAGVRAGWRPIKYLKLQPYASRYKYENLPSIVAFNSSIKGNTVPNPQPTNSKFAFDYEGTLLGIKSELRPNSKLSFIAEFQRIKNDQAPDTFNTGQWGSLTLKTRYNQIIFEPNIGAFYNESDTSPAAYNSAEIGHNNREGMFYKFDVTFQKYNFKLSTGYVVADVVNPNDVQSDMKYMVVTLETLYVEF